MWRCLLMGYIEGEGRNQGALFPVVLDDLVPADHMCRVIDAFVEKLVMSELGFERAQAAETGRPGYDPRDLFGSRARARSAASRTAVMYLSTVLDDYSRYITALKLCTTIRAERSPSAPPKKTLVLRLVEWREWRVDGHFFWPPFPYFPASPPRDSILT